MAVFEKNGRNLGDFMTTSDSKIFTGEGRKYSVWLILILLLSFFLRFSNIYLHPRSYSDAIEEHGLFGENIYKGYGLKLDKDLPPTILRTPLYPYWLASLYSLFGFNHKVALLGQCLLDVLTTFFLFQLGRLLFDSYRIGLLSSFLWAVYFPEFIYTEFLYAEIFGTTLLIIHMYFIIWAWKNPIRKRINFYYVLSGVFLGLVCLTRPEYQFFFIFLVIPVIAPTWKKHKKQFLKGYCIMLISFFIVLSPWVIRNYIVSGKFIVGTTELGHVLYNRAIDNEQGHKYGIDPEISRIYEESSGNYGAYLIHPKYSEAELNNLLTREMVRVILNHPFEFAYQSLQRFFHSWFNYHGWKDRHLKINDFLFILVNLIFFLSMIYAHGWCRQDWLPYTYPILLLIVYKNIIHSLLAGGPRSFLPIWPYFMIYFSYVFFKVLSYSAYLFNRKAISSEANVE